MITHYELKNGIKFVAIGEIKNKKIIYNKYSNESDKQIIRNEFIQAFEHFCTIPMKAGSLKQLMIKDNLYSAIETDDDYLYFILTSTTYNQQSASLFIEDLIRENLGNKINLNQLEKTQLNSIVISIMMKYCSFKVDKDPEISIRGIIPKNEEDAALKVITSENALRNPTSKEQSDVDGSKISQMVCRKNIRIILILLFVFIGIGLAIVLPLTLT